MSVSSVTLEQTGGLSSFWKLEWTKPPSMEAQVNLINHLSSCGLYLRRQEDRNSLPTVISRATNSVRLHVTVDSEARWSLSKRSRCCNKKPC